MTVAPFEFDYRVHEPEEPMDRYIESIWYARGTVPYRRERIAPTGSTVAIFVLGDPLLVVADNGRGERVEAPEGVIIGPHDRPIVNEPLGETYAVGIVTRPTGCETLFGVRPGEIRGRARRLSEIWAKASQIREAVAKRQDPEAMLQYVDTYLGENLCAHPPGLDRVEAAVSMLDDDPAKTIASIASELGVSHGYLDRQFSRVVGLTPRRLSILLRMRRLLSVIDVREDVGWADKAHELGWFDQAHLIRDFKRHTGVTPSEYVAAQRAMYTPEHAGDGAGFVPDPELR